MDANKKIITFEDVRKFYLKCKARFTLVDAELGILKVEMQAFQPLVQAIWQILKEYSGHENCTVTKLRTVIPKNYIK